ncbi:somatostatin receptor type 5-like [Amphiura filiformis]|uniref:somatostatin receptor type 5-like n=1 Tax=Amphiura filiformis TaxID=82378 RepID=UPI003B20FFFD
MAENITNERNFNLNQELDQTDLECLERFNQSLQYYNATRYLTAEETSKYGYTSGQIFSITVLLPLILTFGLLGNFCFIFVSVRVKYMHTVTNRYLVSLAIADIIFLVSAIGPKIWCYTKSPLHGDDSPLGAHGCVWTFFLSDTAYFASLAFTTLVSCDRYLAVCHPRNPRSCANFKLSSTQLIISTWILACVLAASLTPGNSQLVFYCYKWAPISPYDKWPSTIRYCLPSKTWMVSYALGLQTVPFFVSLILNFIFYLSIVRGLDGSIKRLSQKGSRMSHRDTRVRNQIAKMLVLNGVVFFCCLAPFEFISLFHMVASARNEYLIRNEKAKTYITLFARVLSYINACINPVIYTVMCDRYVQAFKYAFCSPISNACRNNNNTNSNTSAKELVHLQTLVE